MCLGLHWSCQNQQNVSGCNSDLSQRNLWIAFTRILQRGCCQACQPFAPSTVAHSTGRSLIRDSWPGSPCPENTAGSLMPGVPTWNLAGQPHCKIFSLAFTTNPPGFVKPWSKGWLSRFLQCFKIIGPLRPRLHRRLARAPLSGAVPKSNSRKSPIGTESTWAGMPPEWNFPVTFWSGADGECYGLAEQHWPVTAVSPPGRS
jgi:hypothetical protein